MTEIRGGHFDRDSYQADRGRWIDPGDKTRMVNGVEMCVRCES